jgi:hypothetical protein
MTKSTNIQAIGPEILRTLHFAVGIDCSGSTSKRSHRLPGKTRLQEMQEEVGMIARAADDWEHGGITLVPFSTHARTIKNVTGQQVENAFAEFHSDGSTNLGDCIRRIGESAVETHKETVGFIFTDGEASDADDVIAAIKDVATRLGRPRIGLVLVQIGNDPDAKAFMEKLDDQLEKQGIPDVISTVTEDEMEGLTFANLAWLARAA